MVLRPLVVNGRPLVIHEVLHANNFIYHYVSLKCDATDSYHMTVLDKWSEDINRKFLMVSSETFDFEHHYDTQHATQACRIGSVAVLNGMTVTRL